MWWGLVVGAAEGTPGDASQWFAVLFPFILMFAFFYFFLLRPQQRHAQQRKEMLDSLRAGDRVITIGGIHGEVTAIHDDVVRVRIAEGVEITMNRSGIGYRKTSDEEAKE